MRNCCCQGLIDLENLLEIYSLENQVLTPPRVQSLTCARIKPNQPTPSSISAYAASQS